MYWRLDVVTPSLPYHRAESCSSRLYHYMMDKGIYIRYNPSFQNFTSDGVPHFSSYTTVLNCVPGSTVLGQRLLHKWYAPKLLSNLLAFYMNDSKSVCEAAIVSDLHSIQIDLDSLVGLKYGSLSLMLVYGMCSILVNIANINSISFNALFAVSDKRDL